MMSGTSRETMVNRGTADRKWIVAAIFGLVISSGCAADGGGSTADKVGNERDPVTFTLGTNEPDASPGAMAIQLFAQRVAEATEGRVNIDPHFGVVPDAQAFEQKLIQRAVNGEFDLVLVRSSAWNTFGVHSVDALQLPGLIDTEEQADRVVTDDQLVGRLLGGFDEIGMTGLALYPEAPRYLLSLDGMPGFALGDLRERIIRAPLSETLFDVYRAVGMTPVDMSFKDFTTQVSEGNITMTENPMYRIVGTASVAGGPTIVADNLTVYTKFLVLSARSDSIAALDGDDATLVRRAASDSIGAFVENREREASWIDDVCAAGHVLVDMSADDRGAFLEAASSVIDAVASGPDGDLVGDIRTAAGTPGPHVLTCPDRTVAATTVQTAVSGDEIEFVLPTKRSDIVPSTGDLPNGIYRFTETLEILDAVEPDVEHTEADEFVGEFVLKDGTIELRYYGLDGRSLGPPDTGGVYQVVGDLIVFAQPPNRSLPGTNGIHLLRWSLEGDTLTLEQVDDKRRDPDFVAPMIRVGDAP
jgi:TRAP-type C4-dicarboxylate transport system substrate-binding protein